MELIVQADAHDTPKPLSVQVPVQTNAEDVVGEMAAKRGISGVRRRTWARDDYQVQHRFLPGQPDILTSSQNRTGWTLGAGLEAPSDVDCHLRVRAEIYAPAAKRFRRCEMTLLALLRSRAMFDMSPQCAPKRT